MKRAIFLALATFALWGGAGVNFAAAQFGTLGQQPRYSPFVNPPINSFQGGGFNTYGILRSPYDTRGIGDPLGTQRLNPDGSLQSPLANQSAAANQPGLQTGHSVTFLDYARFFPLNVPTGGGTTPTLGNAGGFITAGQNFGSFGSVPPGLGGASNMGGFFIR